MRLGPLLAFVLLPLTAAAEPLALYGDATSLTVETAEGPVHITRELTDCALIGGTLQPLIPVEGVHPAGEIEVLRALEDPEAVVLDMRTDEWWLEETIPGAMHMPYTEVALRLDELGCTGSQDAGWSCEDARPVVAFCNGPACGQSPTAIRAMVREGFPPERIWYYRGGMQDWRVLGLTTVEGAF